MKKAIKKLNIWGRSHKKLLLVCLLIYAVLLGLAINIPSINAAMPREVFIGDNPVCYVQNEADAEKVLMDVRKHYVAGDAHQVEFSTNPEIRVEYVNPLKTFSNIVSEEAAAQKIIDSLDQSDTASVTVKHTVTETISFTPETVYKKDETMLAGESRIEQESSDGSMEITSVVTEVNGEEVSKVAFKEITTKEGAPKIIYKGTLGLPTGENWETYEGDPVYNNADDLIATAYNYIGAPYKHGGVSLKTGVSCVGFVRAIYMKYGIKIGNSHKSMETAGIGVSYSNARKGDIICYKGHVGLYIGNGKMLDATSKRGVGVNRVNPKSIIAVRRIVQN